MEKTIKLSSGAMKMDLKSLNSMRTVIMPYMSFLKMMFWLEMGWIMKKEVKERSVRGTR